MRKLSKSDLALHLAEIRAGLTKYNEIKKAELWQMVSALLENPALGLYEIEDKDEYNKELRRLINIYFDLDNIGRTNAIHSIGKKLDYNTLTALYQFMHYHIMALADAQTLVKSRPGEFDALAQEMKERSTSEEFDPTKEKVQLSFVLATDIMRFVVEMAQSGAELFSMIDDKSDQI